MPLLLFVAAALCTVNAPRSRTALPNSDGWLAYEPNSAVTFTPSADRGTRVAALGAAITAVVLLPVALFADQLLDLVSISAPTARLATGLLLVATGVLALGSPGPANTPALPGRRAALVPVAFPTLLTPGLAMLTLSASVDHGPVWGIGVVVLSLATLPLIATVRPTPLRERVLDGVGRLLAGGLIAAALGLLFDGVFDI